MELVLVRHAHRDVSDRTLDNGLSDKGREQVEELIDDLENESLPQSQTFWSSPKQRCIETLTPLSEWNEGTFTIEPLLDEQQPHENQKQFIERLQTLVAKAVALKKTLYLCSHGDVLPELANLLVGLHVDLGKGEAVIVSQDTDNRWELR